MATHSTCELMKVRVSVTICMGLCRDVVVKEAGLDQGDGLSVARPGWGAFPFSGCVLGVLQNSHLTFPWKQLFCARGSRALWGWCAEEACGVFRFFLFVL